jgi:alpha-beta hydrolase superfamily lysophospholipase
LTQAGYILAGFDQRGFGQSAGRKGHTPSLDAYFDDIGHFLDDDDSNAIPACRPFSTVTAWAAS